MEGQQGGPVQHQEAELGLARVAQTEVNVSELRRQKLEVAIVCLLVSSFTHSLSRNCPK